VPGRPAARGRGNPEGPGARPAEPGPAEQGPAEPGRAAEGGAAGSAQQSARLSGAGPTTPAHHGQCVHAPLWH